MTLKAAGTLYFALFLMVTHCEPDRGRTCDALVEQINKSYELIDSPVATSERLKLFMYYDELHCDRIGR